MLTAKPVVQNKFWIVEKDGEKVATIQMGENGNVVLVNKDCVREQFIDITGLKNKYNIVFDNKVKKQPVPDIEFSVYGYPSQFEPFNQLLNVAKKLPVFTKTEDSKSYYCAGYYIIKFETGFVSSFCPKLITLTRYEYRGPFKDKLEMKEQLRLANDSGGPVLE